LRHWTGLVLAAPIFATALVIAAPAQAQECDADYGADQLVLDLSDLEVEVVKNDESTSINLVTRLEKQLPCMSQKLPLGFLGRVYRGIGGGYYVGGDKLKSERWFRTALEIDRTYRYGVEDLPGDHALRMVYSSLLQAEELPPSPVSGMRFVKEGNFYIDGRKLTAATARVARPHILQHETEAGVKTWLIDGNTFPASVMESGNNIAEIKTKDKKRQQERGQKHDVDVYTMGSKAMLVEGSRPPEQIPLIVGGTGMLVAATGLYVGSMVSRRNFNTIRGSETTLRKSQQATNRLTLGALGLLAVGTGTLSYGIVIDDQRTIPTLSGRW
jgi:hypothetical protein